MTERMTPESVASGLFDRVAARYVIGQRQSSPARVLSGDLVEGFNRSTLLDDAYPGPDAYGDDVVPGFMTLALLDALGVFAAAEAAAPRDVASYGVNYGLGRVRFVRMLHAGDAVSADFVVRAVVPRGKGVLVTRDCTVYAEPEHEVALVAEWLTLHLPIEPQGERSDID